MADTRVQLEVEEWVRCKWIPDKFGQSFHPKSAPLSSGGVFNFDAVAENCETVGNISTSGSKTASGKSAVGKMLKIRSDVYFLLLAKASRRLMVFTESDMYERWIQEKESGRVPDDIELFHVEIPVELNKRLINARRIASKEVSPTNQQK